MLFHSGSEFAVQDKIAHDHRPSFHAVLCLSTLTLAFRLWALQFLRNYKCFAATPIFLFLLMPFCACGNGTPFSAGLRTARAVVRPPSIPDRSFCTLQATAMVVRFWRFRSILTLVRSLRRHRRPLRSTCPGWLLRNANSYMDRTPKPELMRSSSTKAAVF
jgi:hypothetical protein